MTESLFRDDGYLRSCDARATNVEVIAAIVIVKKAIPSSITNEATTQANVCLGVTSP